MSYPAFPKTVYLETSYFVRLLQSARGDNHSDCRKCRLLYEHLAENKVRMVGSLFTLEETIFILFFFRVLRSEAKRLNYQDIKEFRKRNPRKFNEFYASERRIVPWIAKEARALGVSFDHPKYSNPSLDATVRIRDYATKLLHEYSVLDSKDAFHVALARCMNIDMLVACDRDFSSVTEIGFFNPLA